MYRDWITPVLHSSPNLLDTYTHTYAHTHTHTNPTHTDKEITEASQCMSLLMMAQSAKRTLTVQEEQRNQKTHPDHQLNYHNERQFLCAVHALFFANLNKKMYLAKQDAFLINWR